MQYKDLTDSAKECAYQQFQDTTYSFNDFQVEDILEDYRDMLETKGLYDLVFGYSGFHSQGDGACFTGDINLRDFLEAHLSIREAHPELEEAYTYSTSREAFLEIAEEYTYTERGDIEWA